MLSTTIVYFRIGSFDNSNIYHDYYSVSIYLLYYKDFDDTRKESKKGKELKTGMNSLSIYVSVKYTDEYTYIFRVRRMTRQMSLIVTVKKAVWYIFVIGKGSSVQYLAVTFEKNVCDSCGFNLGTA